MSATRERHDAFEQQLDAARAAGAGLLEQSLGRWLYQRTGSAELAMAGLAVAVAEQAGHGCAWFDADGRARAARALPAVRVEAVRGHLWCGDGSAPTPLVLDAEGRCYSWRSFVAERDIARALLTRSGIEDAPRPWLAADLEALFAGAPAEATADQRAALSAAVGARLFVLGGGPGTGKTTTVVRWLALLLRRRDALGLPAAPQLRLAAPTGKAAQRLAQSVRDGAAALAGALDAQWSEALQWLPREATTLHRLLGYSPASGRFRHGAALPLPVDVLVVDESSMIDLQLMRALLAALPASARLLLVGDPDQLASVAAGSVLGDIVAATETATSAPATMPHPAPEPRQRGLFDAPPAAQGDQSRAGPGHAAAAGSDAGAQAPPLAGNAFRLRQVWRARGALVQFAEALRQGDADGLRAQLAAPEATGEGVRLLPADDAEALRRRLRQYLGSPGQQQLQTLWRSDAVAPMQALDALARMQLLCALREGPFGAAGINAFVAAWLRQQHGVAADAAWYAGRLVMVTRNDAALGLANGDVGVALQQAGGLAVFFDGRDGDGTRQPRRLSPRLLPEHVDAYALTIHKSQGSEYDAVTVVLPPDADSPILSRELLYTGITRARRQVEVWGSMAALARAAAQPIERHGGLRQRLSPAPAHPAAARHGD